MYLNKAPAKSCSCLSALLLLIAFMALKPDNLGGVTLRLLGVGGGIPISVTLKDVRPSDSPVLTVRGCLILETGSQFAIHETQNPADCHSSAVSANRSAPPRPTFAGVDVYPMTDVVRLS